MEGIDRNGTATIKMKTMKERNHLDIDMTEEILWKLREAQCFATKIKQKMSGNHNIMFE